MTSVSFKADDQFKLLIEGLAARAGITLSAYIKLLLTRSVKSELSQVTENGLTVAEELEILRRDQEEETVGPFHSVDELRQSLRI